MCEKLIIVIDFKGQTRALNETFERPRGHICDAAAQAGNRTPHAEIAAEQLPGSAKMTQSILQGSTSRFRDIKSPGIGITVPHWPTTPVSTYYRVIPGMCDVLQARIVAWQVGWSACSFILKSTTCRDFSTEQDRSVWITPLLFAISFTTAVSHACIELRVAICN